MPKKPRDVLTKLNGGMSREQVYALLGLPKSVQPAGDVEHCKIAKWGMPHDSHGWGVWKVVFSGDTVTDVSTSHATASGSDGKYRVNIVSHGAGGKAYVDRTKKRVYLSVSPLTTNSAPDIFQGKHVFVASDLLWKTQWLTNDAVTVTFYDYGDKIVRYEAEKSGMSSNRTAIITLHLDEKSRRFVETLSNISGQAPP